MRRTRGITSCTGAANWRRWASQTRAQRTSRSGEQPGREVGWASPSAQDDRESPTSGGGATCYD